jgi:hypothetical protein
LNVGGSFHELYALECTCGDETGSVARFGAPCDHLALCLRRPSLDQGVPISRNLIGDS